MNNEIPPEPNNLLAIKPENVSPHILLQTLRGNVHNIEHMYVVAFDKAGEPTLFSTANRNFLPTAALYMQELYLQRLMNNKKQK